MFRVFFFVFFFWGGGLLGVLRGFGGWGFGVLFGGLVGVRGLGGWGFEGPKSY